MLQRDVGETVKRFVDAVCESGVRIDLRIEPIVFQTSAFQTDDWVPIIHEIKAHGIAVELAA